MKKKLLILFIIFNLIPTNLFASPKENIILNFKKVENISFKFKQTINEKTEEGECIIQYPKKINCKYQNKRKKLIVSNGRTLIIKDDRNYYRYPLKTTPLNTILDKNLLIKKMSILDERLVGDKYYNFSLNNNENRINIFFEKKTYNLIGWQTEDIYQNLVIMFIYNIEKNKKIDQTLFKLPKMKN